MKIFVVDDNHDICSLIETLLSAEGYTVISCVNPIIAEEMIIKNQPQLVITDMLMSGVDGRTLIKNIKENPITKHIKVIMMSAHPKILEMGNKSGADNYISKPFDFNNLIEKIKEINFN